MTGYKIGDPLPERTHCPYCKAKLTEHELDDGMCNKCWLEEANYRLNDRVSAETRHSDPGLVYDRRFGDDCPY